MFEIKIGNSFVAVEKGTEIQAYIDSGKATAQTPVRRIGGQKWAKLEQVNGLHFPAPSVAPIEVVQAIPVRKELLRQQFQSSPTQLPAETNSTPCTLD